MVTTRSQSPSPDRPEHEQEQQPQLAAAGAAMQEAAAALAHTAAAAAAASAAAADPQVEATVQLSDLECAVCLGLLCEAVTTPCGHTMCRLCLVRALQRQHKCPACRAVCVISAEDHPETLALTRLARKCFPGLYEQRLEETRQEREAMRLCLPIFFYNVPMFPGSALSLHLFEPRYRLMMQRIVNSTRRWVRWLNIHMHVYKAHAADSPIRPSIHRHTP